MARRAHLHLTVGAAVLVLAGDLASKELAIRLARETVHYHERGAAEVVPFLAVCLAMLALVPLARSAALDLSAGTLIGGALGNIASVLVWTPGVPNFIYAGRVVLNVADVAIVVGSLTLVQVAAVLAARERRARRYAVASSRST